MNLAFVILGAIAALAGTGVLVHAIRNRGDGEDPRTTMLLIAGMMLAAFGVLIAGFAIGYSTAEPLDLNAAVTQ